MPSATPLTQNQLTLGITLIFAVAMLCQVVAPRLRIPALVLLLPAGFVLGTLVPGANPIAILGSSFSPVVALVVAIILFQGGMELGKRRISKEDGGTVLRLVWVGGALTWASATFLTAYFIGLPFAWPSARSSPPMRWLRSSCPPSRSLRSWFSWCGQAWCC